jgi:hypothetical protein
MDVQIAARRRADSLVHAAEMLGVDALLPSTKAPEVERELYLALLIEALAEETARVDALESKSPAEK